MPKLWRTVVVMLVAALAASLADNSARPGASAAGRPGSQAALEHPGSNPVDLDLGRTSARVLASVRQPRFNDVALAPGLGVPPAARRFIRIAAACERVRHSHVAESRHVRAPPIRILC